MAASIKSVQTTGNVCLLSSDGINVQLELPLADPLAASMAAVAGDSVAPDADETAKSVIAAEIVVVGAPCATREDVIVDSPMRIVWHTLSMRDELVVTNESANAELSGQAEIVQALIAVVLSE
ncbi:hypothetical protein HK100_004712 [Physocladia obscura]|uniref:Uncharacterized protein n=1 Tax=Physocladia obscura TaxID=109957 RepID=A0AAD5SSS3_9FUNG|nr:hypothetical protein HK100_004712 [Physocladia obscura]